MLQAPTLLIALAIASQVGHATIPDRPNFTGSWKLEHVAADPRMRTPSGPDYLLGSEMNVVQDVTRLVITRTDPRARAELTFMLDGTESRNSLPEPRGGALLQFLSRLEWNSDTLIVETTVPWVMTQRWSLTPSGQLSIQDVAPNIEVSVSTTHLLYSRKK